MADDIEAGFTSLVKKIEEMKKKENELSAQIRAGDAALLQRMGDAVKGIVGSIGLNMLQKGKQDNKGELYNESYYPKKMIVLGKADPLPYRPDDTTKKVTDQFCVLSEEGKFYELMYSSDGFLTDSYLNALDSKSVLEIYGYDVMYMLYRAMRDYLQSQQDLIDALGKVLQFVLLGEPEPDKK
jgi:hypothetical protein